jgi:uncharacterized protein YdaU (DUF1376 family)
MHYYPHHVGDYQRDTATLSVAEHGAYRLLMDAYYVTERPLPANLGELCRICRAISKHEREAVKMVAARFFTASEDHLRHKRIDEEIAAYTEQREAASRAGKASAEKRRTQRSTNARSTPDENPLDENGNATTNGTATNQEPGTRNHKPREEKGANSAPHSPPSDQEHWPDPREYPTLKTVEQWAEQVMAPKECAAKWHAIRVSENWETQHGRPLQLTALPALFRSYATNWKANGAKFKSAQTKPSEQRLKL